MAFPNRDRERERDLRVNHRIRVPQVRLIGADGSQLGVIATPDAMKMARESGLDLVEISPQANPPVCKILDYGKYKYEKKKKAQEAKKKQIVVKVKEIKLRPNTEDHDLDFKVKHARRFIEDGDKAKFTVVFRGREMAYTDLGRKLMERVLDQLKDVAKVEHPPTMEGKSMIMIMAPGVASPVVKA